MEQDIVAQAVEFKLYYDKFMDLCEKERSPKLSIEEKKKLSKTISEASEKAGQSRDRLFKTLDAYGAEETIRKIKSVAELAD